VQGASLNRWKDMTLLHIARKKELNNKLNHKKENQNENETDLNYQMYEMRIPLDSQGRKSEVVSDVQTVFK
jgi:hypothetical protein